jgi:hypothetical protein
LLPIFFQQLCDEEEKNQGWKPWCDTVPFICKFLHEVKRNIHLCIRCKTKQKTQPDDQSIKRFFARTAAGNKKLYKA